MSKESKHSVESATKYLSKQGIQVENKHIVVKRPVGIRTFGVIDYLCHHAGYNWNKA